MTLFAALAGADSVGALAGPFATNNGMVRLLTSLPAVPVSNTL